MQDLELSEEQIMIRDMARDFARGEIAPHAQAWEKAGWIDDGVVRKMGELGLLGISQAQQPYFFGHHGVIQADHAACAGAPLGRQ